MSVFSMYIHCRLCFFWWFIYLILCVWGFSCMYVCMFVMWTKCMWRSCIGVHHVHTVPVEVMYVCVPCIHSAYEDLYYVYYVHTVPVEVMYVYEPCVHNAYGGHVCMCRGQKSSRRLVTKPRSLTETTVFLTTEPSFQPLVCF